MINLKEIFIAWKTSIRPTELQSKIAEDRLNVCINCPHKKEVLEGKKWTAYCQKCGCPIRKKVFSQEINPCPMGYFGECDTQNGMAAKIKEGRTFL